MDITWHKINEVCDKLSKILRNSGKKFDWIYGVPRGGLIPAVMMSHRLKIPMTMDLNCVGKILVVDDILDSGETLAKVKYIDEVTLAPLFIRKNKVTVSKADFYGEAVDTSAWLKFPWEDKIEDTKSESWKRNVKDSGQYKTRGSERVI
jgi:hypoxanthine phosphoribosyltransferase